MALNQEKDNLSGKMDQNMRVTLKMVISMDLVFALFQKKMEGDWKDNMMGGKGKLVFKDGTKREGIFKYYYTEF
jgi:hypothetical protein